MKKKGKMVNNHTLSFGKDVMRLIIEFTDNRQAVFLINSCHQMREWFFILIGKKLARFTIVDTWKNCGVNTKYTYLYNRYTITKNKTYKKESNEFACDIFNSPGYIYCIGCINLETYNFWNAGLHEARIMGEMQNVLTDPHTYVTTGKLSCVGIPATSKNIIDIIISVIDALTDVNGNEFIIDYLIEGLDAIKYAQEHSQLY